MFRAKYRIQYLDKCQIKVEREKERLTKKRERENRWIDLERKLVIKAKELKVFELKL